MSNRWRVIDEQGGTTWAPQVHDICGNYTCEYGYGAVHKTERMAVVAWAARNCRNIAEIVAPDALSASERERAVQKRCAKAIDDMWERVRLMGEAEGGNGTGGEVVFVIDDACGTDTQQWTADECDDALNGIHLAASAVTLIDLDEERDDE